MSHPQKGKGHKRPRRFHRGQAEGRLAVAPLDRLAHAEARARTADDELRSVAARYHEQIDVWADFGHAKPFAPRIEAAL